MPRLVVEGSQWGDEGKGKITDYLAMKADVVVRFQGGNNAGHTIVFDGHKYALKLLPSGIFNPHIKNVLANGMVINPKALLEELKGIEEKGFTNYQLFISDRAHILMPYHLDLDGAYESKLSDNKIGTTKKGIGPCYTDKAARFGLRMGDLVDPIELKERLKNTLTIKNMELEMLDLKPYDLENLYQELLAYAEKLKPHICDTSILLNHEIELDSKILFEGAQGMMLCLDHGTYPYVTSSCPAASSVPLNAGIAPKFIDKVLGICKAYTTRVGEGPFPSELFNSIGDDIREKGHEYGTVTKRPRRIGYLDTVVINHARRCSGIDYIALMLLDVLSGIEELKICTHYELDGEVIDYIPSSLTSYQKCKPCYITLKGWKEDITQVNSFEELPLEAQEYIKKIEELTKTKVVLFSVGPDRKQTIIIEEIF